MFNLKQYIDVQEARTDWMAERLPRMLDLVNQMGHRERPKSTMRSYTLQEKEAISCQAKMRWADWEGHEWFSIEHDGLGVGLVDGTNPEDAAKNVTGWVSKALGYKQEVQVKPMPRGGDYGTKQVQPLCTVGGDMECYDGAIVTINRFQGTVRSMSRATRDHRPCMVHQSKIRGAGRRTRESDAVQVRE